MEANTSKKRKRRPSWVAGKGSSLPRMTSERCLDVKMDVRGTEADELFLRCPVVGSDEQPCRNGADCVGKRDLSGGPGYPLRRMDPSPQCILCLRREMKAKWVRHTVLEETVLSTRLCQRWESRVGVPGGYRADCCIGPSGQSWNGFVSNVAVGVSSDYTWVYESDTQTWRVDQSQLYFREAPSKSPRFDGALSDF